MWVTTIISIIAIYFAYLSQFKSKGKYLELGFLLLTIIASIQYGYGSDYMRYFFLWEQYSSLDAKGIIHDFFEQEGWQEPGWILLNAIFSFKNGFFVLVALISIVENFIYYLFIREYVPVKWRWFAVFLYVGMDNLYLLNFSMLRQGLTIALFVAVVMLLIKRKIWQAIVLMTLSLTIHLSSAVCLPFLIVYFLPLRKTTTIALLLLSFTLIIFVFKDVVTSGLNLVFSFEELGKYSDYGQKTLSGIGFGYLLNHIPNIVILYVLLTDKLLKTREHKVLALLTFCDMLITPLQFYGADMAGRLGTYFMAFRVAAVPIVYSRIKERSVQPVLVLIAIFSTFVMYIQFFQHYTEGGYAEGYRTIFSVL